MATRKVSFVPGEYYHIFNRGNSKQNIFSDKSDYDRFLFLLYISNSTQSFNVRDLIESTDDLFDILRKDMLVSVHAYCLMPNHFHLLISPKTERGVSAYMLKLSTGYSMYFNKKYERTGSLFEGTFKSLHVDTDEYLKYLFSYIHLNPVSIQYPKWKDVGLDASIREKAFYSISQYQYSSLYDYVMPLNTSSTPRVTLGVERPQESILDKDMYSHYFNTGTATRSELFDWLSYEDGFVPEL